MLVEFDRVTVDSDGVLPISLAFYLKRINKKNRENSGTVH